MKWFTGQMYSRHSLFVQWQTDMQAWPQPADDALVQRTVLLALIPVVVAFSFIVFVFYRSRREAQFRQKEIELKLSLVMGELKALRAQINPHFIFNCLNSIHHYMLANNGQQAGEYLIKFSDLIRHVLESSALRSVSLADEIEANKLYIELEQMRLQQKLSYAITMAPDLNPNQVDIPPMMIQPFVENAIWHGLTTGGHVHIHFTAAPNQHVQCIINDESTGTDSKPTDTGPVSAAKKTSMGLTLMRERFERINQLHQTQASFQVINRSDGVRGKQAILTIPIL